MATIENKGPDISHGVGLRVTANTCVASLTQFITARKVIDFELAFRG